MNPNQNITQISQQDFTDLLTESIEQLALYKGLSLSDDNLARIVQMLFNIRQRYKLITVNLFAKTISALYNSDLKKITVESIDKSLFATNIELFQKKDEQDQVQLAKHIDNSHFAKAMTLRLEHDKGGKILDENGDTLEAVMEMVRAGMNYYTGDVL